MAKEAILGECVLGRVMSSRLLRTWKFCLATPISLFGPTCQLELALSRSSKPPSRITHTRSVLDRVYLGVRTPKQH